GPLAVDPLAVLVDEHRGVALARVQLGEVRRNRDAGGVHPWSVADARARVGRPVAVARIAFDAEIRAPRPLSEAHRRGEALTERVGAVQPAQIAGPAGPAGDEEAHRPGILSRSRRGGTVTASGRADDRHYRYQGEGMLHVMSSAASAVDATIRSRP